MTWITTIPYDAASGRLKMLYDRVAGPGNNVDNIMLAHSLRPHSMEGHMALYKQVLHHAGNTVPTWFLETIGVQVSLLNRCNYCVEHHFAGLQRLLGDDKRADAMRACLESGQYSTTFDQHEQMALAYAAKLTQTPAAITAQDVASLCDIGFDDGQILEINQVVAYFAYANRTVLGLGVNTEGDILGLSPNNVQDTDNWSHT